MSAEAAEETIYCKHGCRGNCPACGRIIVIRLPWRAVPV